jgi:hypothetical protein
MASSPILRFSDVILNNAGRSSDPIPGLISPP